MYQWYIARSQVRNTTHRSVPCTRRPSTARGHACCTTKNVGDGPLVVLLHGIIENSTAWEPVTERLAETHRVLALDLRGHGRSPAQPPYDTRVLVEDVWATLSAAAPQEAPLLVGHSLGGLVATVYATALPVRAVLTVDHVLDFALMQQATQSLLPALATPRYEAVFDAMFLQLEAGALPRAASARLKNLRRYDRDLVLEIWGGGLKEVPPAALRSTRPSCSALSGRPTWRCTGPNRARSTGPGSSPRSRTSSSRPGPAVATIRTWWIRNGSSNGYDSSTRASVPVTP